MQARPTLTFFLCKIVDKFVIIRQISLLFHVRPSHKEASRSREHSFERLLEG